MRNPICYVGGDSFKNIFGGASPTHFGSVSHLVHPNSATARWPYLLNMFVYSEASGFQENFKTWKAFKKWIKERHPDGVFQIYWEEFRTSFPDAEYVTVEEGRLLSHGFSNTYFDTNEQALAAIEAVGRDRILAAVQWWNVESWEK